MCCVARRVVPSAALPRPAITTATRRFSNPLHALSIQAWQLLRMLALWGIHKASVARVVSIGKTLCRVYLGVGLGFLQPMFLLTALLLAQHSLGCACSAPELQIR